MTAPMPAPVQAALRAELAARVKAAVPQAEQDLWRRMISLAEQGDLTLAHGETPAEASKAMLTAVQATLERRVEQCAAGHTEALERRIAGLRPFRDQLLRAAIRAGATLPSFDVPAETEQVAA